jgi:hypothetical protein
MLHTKIYYMEMPEAQACAFVGSHNLTSYALGGLNAEAAILIEGAADAVEFQRVRDHIEGVRKEASPYSPALKEAYAWWSKQYFEGLGAEIDLPQGWRPVRTILVLAQASGNNWPTIADLIYFELPSGIHIQSLATEVHLFLFKRLPSTPSDALALSSSANAKYTCSMLGVDNEQGNIEVRVNWQLEQVPLPVLHHVPSGLYRPSTLPSMQQARASVRNVGVKPFDYGFERKRAGWDVEFSPDSRLLQSDALPNTEGPTEGERVSAEWRLVANLVPRSGSTAEDDQAALALVSPESSSFVLVSLRRRRKS